MSAAAAHLAQAQLLLRRRGSDKAGIVADLLRPFISIAEQLEKESADENTVTAAVVSDVRQ